MEVKKSSKGADTGKDQASAEGRPKRNRRPTEAEAAIGRDATRYGKGQILGSVRYRGQRDLSNALLEEGKRYSLEEVDALLEKYLKGKVM